MQLGNSTKAAQIAYNGTTCTCESCANLVTELKLEGGINDNTINEVHVCYMYGN